MPVYGPAEERLNQGDLFSKVAVVIPRAVRVRRQRRRQSLALVTSHDCDCDRYKRAVEKGQGPDVLRRFPLLVAPVHPIAELADEGLHGDIRKARVPRYFHIPAEDECEEMVADLWFEQPVPAMELLQLRRMATLSEEWKRHLAIQIFRLRSHLREEDVFKEDWRGAT